MQTPRFTHTLMLKAEELVDYIRHAASDNTIDQHETSTIDYMADDLYRHTQVYDANVQDIVARLRTGPDSQRVQRTSRELRASLRLIDGTAKRPADGTPLDAA